MSQRIDRSQVGRLSLDSFHQALDANQAQIQQRARAAGLEGDAAAELKRVAFNVVFDSGELTVAGVKDEILLSSGAAAAARLLETLLNEWLASGQVTIDSRLDQTPIDVAQLRSQIAARSKDSLREVDLAIDLLDPLQTGQIKFVDVKALRADLVHVQRDLESPTAAGARTLQSFLMTSDQGELARLLPRIKPGAERFTQPFESLT